MFNEYREKYPNIGRRWDSEQNSILLNLLKSNKSTSMIAEYMGRSENGILIQSVKLLRNQNFKQEFQETFDEEKMNKPEQIYTQQDMNNFFLELTEFGKTTEVFFQKYGIQLNENL